MRRFGYHGVSYFFPSTLSFLTHWPGNGGALLKRRSIFKRLQGIISKKAVIFTHANVKSWDLISLPYFRLLFLSFFLVSLLRPPLLSPSLSLYLSFLIPNLPYHSFLSSLYSSILSFQLFFVFSFSTHTGFFIIFFTMKNTNIPKAISFDPFLEILKFWSLNSSYNSLTHC